VVDTTNPSLSHRFPPELLALVSAGALAVVTLPELVLAVIDDDAVAANAAQSNAGP
jgi:hypothetical protein